MNTKYWNTESLIARRLGIAKIASRFPNMLQSIPVDRTAKDAALEFVQKEFLPRFRTLLSSHGTFEGIDLIDIDVGTLLFRRTRLYRIVRFIEAVHRFEGARLSVFPSFHYSDWLIVQTQRAKKMRPTLLSMISAMFAKAALPFSDRRTYRHRTLEASNEVPQKKFSLLFVAGAETHLRNLLPLVTRAKDAGVFVARSSEKWPSIRKVPASVGKIRFWDFLTSEDISAFEADHKRFERFFREHTKEIAQLCRYRDVDFWALIDDAMEEYFTYILPLHALLVRVAGRILDTCGVKSIVNSRINRDTESALAALARERSIRVTTVVHGLIGNDPDTYFSSGRFDVQNGVFVWNAAQVAHVKEKAGIQNVEIILDGNPQWEGIDGSEVDRAEFLEAHGISGEETARYEKIITFCAQPSNPPSMWRDMKEAALAAPKTLLIIKTHPTVPASRIIESMENLLPNLRVVDDHVPLYNLLRVSDLMITAYSTTIFDSLVVGTPAILYHTQSVEFINELRSYGMPAVTSLEALKKLLAEKKTKEAYLSDCAEFQSRYIPRVDYEGISDRILAFATRT